MLPHTSRLAQMPNITKEFYATKSRDIDIIKLNGSIELAPILGLSDVIVDIVETGTT
ncbi:MAG: ATP phosphoribosyltransferase, partial [Bacteroidales bacterium]|nr:ATP phosphoribosyltransferase [Bacteroidales bacterium]